MAQEYFIKSIHNLTSIPHSKTIQCFPDLPVHQKNSPNRYIIQIQLLKKVSKDHTFEKVYRPNEFELMLFRSYSKEDRFLIYYHYQNQNKQKSISYQDMINLLSLPIDGSFENSKYYVIDLFDGFTLGGMDDFREEYQTLVQDGNVTDEATEEIEYLENMMKIGYDKLFKFLGEIKE